MSKVKTKSMFAAKPGHPNTLCVVFFRETPKAMLEFAYCTTAIGNALVAVATMAKERGVPQGKYEIVCYTPVVPFEAIPVCISQLAELEKA